MLPDYELAIIDEGHTLEGMATDHLGTATSDSQVRFLLTGLFNDRTGRGILAGFEAPEVTDVVRDAYQQSKRLFDNLSDVAVLSQPRHTAGSTSRNSWRTPSRRYCWTWARNSAP